MIRLLAVLLAIIVIGCHKQTVRQAPLSVALPGPTIGSLAEIRPPATEPGFPSYVPPTEVNGYTDPKLAWGEYGSDGFSEGVTDEESKAFIDSWTEGKTTQYILVVGTRVQIQQTGVDGHANLTKIKVMPDQQVFTRTLKAEREP